MIFGRTSMDVGPGDHKSHPIEKSWRQAYIGETRGPPFRMWGISGKETSENRTLQKDCRYFHGEQRIEGWTHLSQWRAVGGEWGACVMGNGETVHFIHRANSKQPKEVISKWHPTPNPIAWCEVCLIFLTALDLTDLPHQHAIPHHAD